MTSTISEPVSGRDARDARAGRPPSASRVLLERRLARDKLRVPHPNVPLLNRHRLTGLIQCATARRVTVVCGPTGAGKTIACAQWAAGQQVAWVSLDPGDRRPARLWAHVRGALAEHPNARDLAGELPDPADGSFPLQLAQVSERLPAPVTLVIDDVQELAGSESQASLELLVRHGPPSLRLLLAGLGIGGLSVARLRVGGDLAEIGSADLACTAQETRDYFAMLGVELPGEQLDELLGRTQGWITGLRLAALRSGPGQTGSVPWRIAGDEPCVADYLRDEILASQPADRRDFLLRTCLVDRICGELADVLTGTDGGSATLDRLCRENVMIGPAENSSVERGAFDPECAEYRYHPLLLDLLRAQLRRELPGEVRLLAKRAASWQASRGQHADALASAVWSGDWDFAVEILAQTGPELLLPGPASVLEPVLATFPASRYTSDAAVAGALAASGLRTGDSCATQLHLDNAVTALDRCAPGQRPVVAIWLRALMVMRASAAGKQRPDTDAAAAVAREAGATASDAASHQAVGLLWTALGVAALAELRVADARAAFTQACWQLSHGGRPEFKARAQAWRAIAEAIHGDLLTAGGLIDEPPGGDLGGTDPVAARLGRLAGAWLRLAMDETAIARRLLDQHDATQHADPGDRVATLLTTMASASLALGQGDLAAARRLAAKLRYDNAAPDLALAALDADVALGGGDVAKARLALARAEAADPGRASALTLSWAKLLLAEGDCQAALARAQSCLAAGGEEISLRDRITALVTAAVAQRKLGNTEAAADQLGYALALAEPHGEYRPFLDGGSAVRSALTVLIRPTSQGAACAARILQRYETRPSRQAEAQATIPLTSSELAVLRFLPSHMTNQEIAETLFLSINTVKTHLRSVYRKLGVTTRRQAISAAGRLGLL